MKFTKIDPPQTVMILQQSVSFITDPGLSPKLALEFTSQDKLFGTLQNWRKPYKNQTQFCKILKLWSKSFIRF